MKFKDSYPRIGKFTDTLLDAHIFTTVDIFNGFLQIDVPKEQRGQTPFIYHVGQLQCTPMYFGLTKSPATLQRGFDVILSGFKLKTFLVLIDYIIIILNQSKTYPTSR